MAFPSTSGIDNRHAQEVYEYLEARVEALMSRVAELENENEILRSKLRSECGTVSHLFNSRPNSY
jgi:hypothetical protein